MKLYCWQRYYHNRHETVVYATNFAALTKENTDAFDEQIYLIQSAWARIHF